MISWIVNEKLDRCIWLLFATSLNPHREHLLMQTPVESKTRTYHGRVGSARPSERRGGSAKIGCQQNCSPRKRRFTVPSKASKKRRFNVSAEARISEILCQPTEEQNQRLTRGRQPVPPRFIRGLATGQEAFFVPGCQAVERRLLVFVNSFHARHVREQKPFNKSFKMILQLTTMLGIGCVFFAQGHARLHALT